MYPPLPTDRGLKFDWNGNPIPFHSNVTYTCAKSNLYFEQDRNMKSFTIECLNDGTFDEPIVLSDWPSCVDSKDEFFSVSYGENDSSILQFFNI